ncbi:hypothetical protein [Simkania negevensis]|uniref:Uncharacterized protein n=1 Tax=Simkania negevensis (strain ATCC VR-1471 / DSM 27360 / Z) TaxID=331113 RepID=F8L3F3_SIMNZ|nr:hypothetical protein [Simkania negevensis]CCB89806.1 unknown protein [Simkania negevensis Z]
MSYLTNISQNRFLVEAGCHLALGLICAKASSNLRWKATGLLLGSANGCSLKLADYLGNSSAFSSWSKIILKCLTFSATSFLTAQLAAQIKSATIFTCAGLSLLTDFVLKHFIFTSLQTQSFPATPQTSTTSARSSTSSGLVNIEKAYHEETLELLTPAIFSTTQLLLDGLFAWFLSSEFPNGMDKNSENAYFYVHFSHVQLVRLDGTLLKNPIEPIKEQNFLLMECLRYNTLQDVQTKTQAAVENFLDHHDHLPKKLILPIGGTARIGGIGHTACLVIEPEGNNFNVTGLDSLSSSSTFGWHEAATGIQQALQNHFPSSTVRVIGNNWCQNNAMKCGVHALKNILFAADYPGPLFNLVAEVNTGGSPLLGLASRTDKELKDSSEAMQREIYLVFEKIYKMNPGKLFIKTTQGNFPLKIHESQFKKFTEGTP